LSQWCIGFIWEADVELGYLCAIEGTGVADGDGDVVENGPEIGVAAYGWDTSWVG
jgi:hypothetical protein